MDSLQIVNIFFHGYMDLFEYLYAITVVSSCSFHPKIFTLIFDIIILNPVGYVNINVDSIFYFEVHFLPQNFSNVGT